MSKTGGLRVGRSVIAALLLIANLLMQDSAGATPITPEVQQRLNRMAISLMLGGFSVPDTMDLIGTFENCIANSAAGGDQDFKINDCVRPKVDELKMTADGLRRAAGMSGFWFFSEQNTKTSGRIIIGPTTNSDGDTDYNVTEGTYTVGKKPSSVNFTSAEFTFFNSADGFDFHYQTNDGDSGRGYIFWLPSGCALLGAFYSDKFKDSNGNAIHGAVAFRRCNGTGLG